MPTTVTTKLTIGAPVSVVAAAADKPARLNVLAYSGGLMQPAGWPVLAIDLDGLEWDDELPVLCDHENRLEAVLGTGSPEVAGGRLGVLVSLADSKAATRVLALINSGVPLQASVGVEPNDGAVERFKSGDQVTVNGRDLSAPSGGLLILRKSRLREISLVPLGADSGTSVTLAATAAFGGTMPAITNPVTNSPAGPDPVAVERARVSAVTAVLSEHAPDQVQAAIDGGWDIHKANEVALASLRAARPQSVPAAYSGGNVDPKSILAASALMLTGRQSVAEKSFGERVCSQASDLRVHSTLDLCRAALRVSGVQEPISQNDMIRAAFSTLSLPVALGSSMEKAALDQFSDSPATWQSFCRKRPVNNFRETPFTRVHFGGAFTETGAGGELKSIVVTEDASQTVKADTYGAIVQFTRQDVINDDLGQLMLAAEALGRMSARKISDSVWTLLLESLATFFTSGRGNLIAAGGSSALSVDALATACQKMRKQTDENSATIDMRPRTLVVCPELEQRGRQILNSLQLQRYVASGVDNQPQGNPFSGADLTLEVEPRISNTAFTGASATGWFLFASPAEAPVNLALVGGNLSPTVEVVNLPANVLGSGFRGFHDFGAGLGEYRAAVYSPGT